MKQELINEIIAYIEEVEHIIEGEWGTCKSISELIENKEMPDVYYKLVQIRVKDSNPIPITQEELLRLGFVLVEDLGDMKYYQMPNQKYGYGVCFDHDELSFYRFNINDTTTLIYDMPYFQYIHHLQNLWFSLTGEELCYR